MSIDEWFDSTYLLFKDKSLEVCYEIMVTPDTDVDSKILEYIGQVHTMASMFYATPTQTSEEC